MLFENDGCTLFPDGTWRACCDVHDEAFASGTTLAEFIGANLDLITCAWPYSPIAAVIMGIGVFTGGAAFFFLGQKRTVNPSQLQEEDK